MLHVPGRPNLAFTGQPIDIWYVFVAHRRSDYLRRGLTGITCSATSLIPVQACLSWMLLRWIVANLSSNGQPLPISFNGSALGLRRLVSSDVRLVHHHHRLGLGHHGLDALDLPQHPAARGAKSSSTAPDWKLLWRTIVFAIGCAFIIPIPWVLRWYARWLSSQFALRSNEAACANAVRPTHLRWRTEPSCATDATSVPSGLKIRPRVRPRPPCALGESCA